jgi:hypothetical protein
LRNAESLIEDASDLQMGIRGGVVRAPSADITRQNRGDAATTITADETKGEGGGPILGTRRAVGLTRHEGKGGDHDESGWTATHSRSSNHTDRESNPMPA